MNPGDDVTLECLAHGLPNPEIKWTHPDGNPISNKTERMSVSEIIVDEDGVHGTIIKGLLKIDNLVPSKDYGTYGCMASNSVGEPDILTIHINGTSKL